MSGQMKLYPAMFLAACTFFCSGIFAALASLLLLSEASLRKGFLLLSISLLCLGAGELLNHPKQRSLQTGESGAGPGYSNYRTRNPCGLGNLLIILAVLLLFGGASVLLYG